MLPLLLVSRVLWRFYWGFYGGLWPPTWWYLPPLTFQRSEPQSKMRWLSCHSLPIETPAPGPAHSRSQLKQEQGTTSLCPSTCFHCSGLEKERICGRDGNAEWDHWEEQRLAHHQVSGIAFGKVLQRSGDLEPSLASSPGKEQQDQGLCLPDLWDLATKQNQIPPTYHGSPFWSSETPMILGESITFHISLLQGGA